MAKEQKSNAITWILVLAVVGLIGVNVVFVLSRDGAGLASVDEPAPNFTLPVVNPSGGIGNELELASLEGKAVVIEFWSTTCGICVKSFPNINRLHQISDPDELVVMTINQDRASPETMRAGVENFLNRNGYKVTTLLDNGSVSSAYGVTAVPTTVLINPDGTVAKIHEGSMSLRQLEREVAELVDG